MYQISNIYDVFLLSRIDPNEGAVLMLQQFSLRLAPSVVPSSASMWGTQLSLSLDTMIDYTSEYPLTISTSSMSPWIGVDTYTEYLDHPDSNLQGGARSYCLDSSIEELKD